MSAISAAIQPAVRGIFSSALVPPIVEPTPLQALAAMYAAGAQGVWADVSDLSTLFQDNADTVPAAVGQPVRRIRDKSGRGNHLTAANPAILRQDAGGRYYLEGNGTNIAFASAAFASPGAANHILCVGMVSLGANINYSVIAQRAVSSPIVGMVLQRTNVNPTATLRVDSSTTPAQSITGGTPFNLSRHVLSGVIAGGASIFRDNKAQVGSALTLAGSTDHSVSIPLSLFSGVTGRDPNQFANIGIYGCVYLASSDIKSIDVVESCVNQTTAAF
jgi:hypothetical protein